MASWPEPWFPIERAEMRAGLEAELRREVRAGHPLFGVPAAAIAARGDQDDVLFELTDGRVAEVHLTWRRTPEPDPRWPGTTIYPSLEAWKESGVE